VTLGAALLCACHEKRPVAGGATAPASSVVVVAVWPDRSAAAPSTRASAEPASTAASGRVAIAPVCEPGRIHCDNGDVVRCNAAGSGRVLVESCAGRDPTAICESSAGPPACRTSCRGEPGATLIMREHDCEPCPWDKVDFCANESPERSCQTDLCTDHELHWGMTLLPCVRETARLVVPGSERRGPCDGGAVASMTIDYQVCQDGKAKPAKRTVPCPKSSAPAQ